MYYKCSKIANKMWVTGTEIHKMLVRNANREDPFSEAV